MAMLEIHLVETSESEPLKVKTDTISNPALVPADWESSVFLFRIVSHGYTLNEWDRSVG